MRLLYGIIVFLMLTAAAIPAGAQGILFVQKETRNGQTGTNEVQLDKTHMRAEAHEGGRNNVVIYDATKQVIDMVDLSAKTYREVNKADMDQLKGQADSALAQMQEQLKNLPPQQRQAIEQMMRARGGLPGANPAASGPKIQYRAAGSDKVGQWTCTKYEGYVGQQKTSEVCTVDPKDLGLTAADFEVGRQLAEFMKTLAPAAADRLMTIGKAEEQGFSGVPVRQISYQNGQVDSTLELTEVRHTSFPASTFEVPAGFTKEAIGPGARRGR
jgi:hypothetical protein